MLSALLTAHCSKAWSGGSLAVVTSRTRAGPTVVRLACLLQLPHPGSARATWCGPLLLTVQARLAEERRSSRRRLHLGARSGCWSHPSRCTRPAPTHGRAALPVSSTERPPPRRRTRRGLRLGPPARSDRPLPAWSRNCGACSPSPTRRRRWRAAAAAARGCSPGPPTVASRSVSSADPGQWLGHSRRSVCATPWSAPTSPSRVGEARLRDPGLPGQVVPGAQAGWRDPVQLLVPGLRAGGAQTACARIAKGRGEFAQAGPTPVPQAPRGADGPRRHLVPGTHSCVPRLCALACAERAGGKFVFSSFVCCS